MPVIVRAVHYFLEVIIVAKGFGATVKKQKAQKVKIGEFAAIVHAKHGRGFFVNCIGRPLTFWKGTSHLNEMDSLVVNSYNLDTHYVVVDFPNGDKDGFSALMTFNLQDKAQFRVWMPSGLTKDEMANHVLVCN